MMEVLGQVQKEKGWNSTVAALIKAPQEPPHRLQIINHSPTTQKMNKSTELNRKVTFGQSGGRGGELKLKKKLNKEGNGREGSGKYFHLLVVLLCGTLCLELRRKLMFNYWKHNSSHSIAKQYLQYILSRHRLIDRNIEKLQHGWSASVCVRVRTYVRWLVAQWKQQWQNARTRQKLKDNKCWSSTWLFNRSLIFSSSINRCLSPTRAGLIINFTLFVRMVCRLSSSSFSIALCDCLKYDLSLLSAHLVFFSTYCWHINSQGPAQITTYHLNTQSEMYGT